MNARLANDARTSGRDIASDALPLVEAARQYFHRACIARGYGVDRAAPTSQTLCEKCAASARLYEAIKDFRDAVK